MNDLKGLIDAIIEGIKKLMQPIITLVAIFAFLGLANNGYDPDKIFYVVAGVLIFWFGYTGLKNFTWTGGKPSNGAGSGSTELPKPDGGGAASASEGASSAPVVGEPSAFESFDRAAFDGEIEGSVVQVHGIKNQATKFYHAWNRGIGRYDPKDPDWADYIKELVNLYFSEIWGLRDAQGNLIDEYAVAYATEHLNDPQGCTTCAASCTSHWTSLKEKAYRLGPETYHYALQWVWEVDKYLKGK